MSGPNRLRVTRDRCAAPPFVICRHCENENFSGPRGRCRRKRSHAVVRLRLWYRGRENVFGHLMGTGRVKIHSVSARTFGTRDPSREDAKSTLPTPTTTPPPTRSSSSCSGSQVFGKRPMPFAACVNIARRVRNGLDARRTTVVQEICDETMARREEQTFVFSRRNASSALFRD